MLRSLVPLRFGQFARLTKVAVNENELSCWLMVRGCNDVRQGSIGSETVRLDAPNVAN